MAGHDPRSEAEARLREHGLAYPATHEDFPWGHRALKVKGKAFAFLAWEGGRFSLSAKLPQSHVRALDLPFAEPTGYGLGKSGWVTATFEEGERVPVDVLKQWLDESWRAIAPKSALKELEGGAQPARETRAKPRARSAAPAKAAQSAKSGASSRPISRKAAQASPTKRKSSPRAKRRPGAR